MTSSFRQIEFTLPNSRPVSYLKLDLNDPTTLTDLFSDNSKSFSGIILIYDENLNNQTKFSSDLIDWFDNKLNKDNRVHNRDTFKKCLLSKQKCDQLLIEALNNLPKINSTDEVIGLNFLLFFYDLENRTFYLYSVGMFDFFLYNGKVSGSPIAPLQNRNNVITVQDLSQPDSTILNKTIHLVFENGLTSDGFFLYCGVPIEKTNPIHNSPLLSRVFYRLKRDNSKECQQEMEERLKKVIPKLPESNLLSSFYYVLGFIPN